MKANNEKMKITTKKQLLSLIKTADLDEWGCEFIGDAVQIFRNDKVKESENVEKQDAATV